MGEIVVIGAGPAGLAAARELARAGRKPVVVEELDTVGGLARTIVRGAARFDIGPHRFFTKSAEVEKLWREVLPSDLLDVDRLTRIFYRGRFFGYPLRPFETLFGIGAARSVSIVASYIIARLRALFPRDEPKSFEDWTVRRFGRKLFETFFRTYTEKVWGIPCAEIGPEWAAQRIRDLSLWRAIWNALSPRKETKIKTLVERFHFPRLGAGMLCERMVEEIASRGGRVLTGTKTVALRWEGEDGTRRARALRLRAPDGKETEIEVDEIVSSAPITELALFSEPAPPAEVLEAARALRFRGHISVELLAEGPTFPDNWVYVHAPELRMARVANFRNFSAAMAPADDLSPVAVEYFAFPGDEIWRKSDAELLALATEELARSGLAKREVLRPVAVVRSPSAYPLLSLAHGRPLAVLREWLAGFANLQTIGRAGLFRYNNQDHAVMTGLLAARNVLAGSRRYDVWAVNVDAEYLEEGRSEAGG